MKKLLILAQRLALLSLICLFISANMVEAQEWQIYDADDLPTESDPAFKISDDEPADDMVAEIIQDPDDPNNDIFRYIQTTGHGRTTYTMEWDIGSGTQATIVVRVRGVQSIKPDSVDRVMEFDIRNDELGIGEKLQMYYDDTLRLSSPDLEGNMAKVDSITKWHIYRLTMNGKQFAAFVDEATDPLIFTTTDKERSGDNWFKLGDQSDDMTLAGVIDWIIWDVSGAYAPGEGAPIPDNLSTEHYEKPSGGTGISETGITDVEIYPNPAQSEITIQTGSGLANDILVSVSDISGVTHLEEAISVHQQKSVRIDISSLQAGFYIVNITDGNETVSETLVIQ